MTGVAVAKRSDYWKTPEALERHATNRRTKYVSDPAYAEAERVRQRELYRLRTGKSVDNGAREALEKMSRIRKTPRELSTLMGRWPNYLARLIAKDLWPAPTDGLSYTPEQARALLEVFAEHLDRVSTYRNDHQATRQKLFAVLGGHDQ